MIRPQYHFRPSPAGLLAWDVRRLIALSQDFRVQTIPLAMIAELDENHWYGWAGDLPTPRSIAAHCALIQAADLAYPIILDERGRIMDGMHRVCKALLLGLEEITAVQFPQDPPPDYIGRDPDSLPYDN